MNSFLMTSGWAALAFGIAGAANADVTGPSRSLHVDPLSLHVDPLSLHVDPLSLHVDPLSLHVDPLQQARGTRLFDANSLHVDPLSLHVDPLSLHVDPLSLHVDPLSLHVDPLAVGYAALQWGSLSGNGTMVGPNADFFWGTFDPLSLHVDPLSLHVDPLSLHVDPLSLHVDPLSLHVDPLSLHVDPLSLHVDPLSLHVDPLSLHVDPLSLHVDPLSLHVDPLSLHVDPLSLHVDPLSLHVDPLSLHVDPLSLHVDPLAVQLAALSLHVDALSLHVDPLSLHVDPLSLHVDPLSLHVDPLSLHVDPLSLHVDPLSLHVDPLSLHVDPLSLHVDPLSLHVDPLSLHVDPLSLHVDPLVLSALVELSNADSISFERLSLHVDPLMSLVELADDIDALAERVAGIDINALSLHVDPLELADIQQRLNAISGMKGLAAQLRQIGEAAVAINKAYTDYKGLYAAAEERYGAFVEARTGLGFEDGFLEGFFDKHGMAGDGFADFLAMDEAERTRFLIDFNDQLFTFLGVDHPDHWMSAVNWSPRLAELAGSGAGVTIGFVDQAFDGAGGLAEAPTLIGPVFEGQDHGRAVTGVAAGALDGSGVMGVAPGADLVLANPFDAAGAADEFAVMDAITAVGRSGAGIINLSLGESGATFSDGWNDVFRNDDVQSVTSDALFVMAAGNDGLVQIDDVDMSDTAGAIERIMIVGALDPSGDIASFSNTPGQACFTVGSSCTPMMDRFITAPGQQILVATPDGVGRASGTSFAAPMVSGAAALLQSRWEWLAQEPEATAEILFRSADDLGAPGVDEVFGWGRLNISASQRPLDMGNLLFRTGGGATPITDAGLSPELMARVRRLDAITAFETIGDTYRDFEIPVGVLQAAAFDPAVTRQNAVEQYFGDRLGVTSGTVQSVAGLSFSATGRFTDAAPIGAVALGGDRAGWTLSLEAREPAHGLALPEGSVPFETHGVYRAVESGFALSFGHGDGALAFTGSSFAMTSDHDILTGGVNPMLGLASGGGYVRAELPVGERLTLSGGISGRTDADLVVDPFSGELTERIAGTGGYRAAAANAALAYALSERATLSFGFTALSEEDGFLGGQSVGALSFGETAESRSVTMGFGSNLGMGFTIDLSASAGRTTAGRATSGALGIDQGGILTSAYQAAIGKAGIFGKRDHLRVSFAQPLHVESGALAVETLDVVDRSTGELGFVTDTIRLDQGDRRYVGEVLYGLPVGGRGAHLSFFGQYDTSPLLTPLEPAASGGVRFNVRF